MVDTAAAPSRARMGLAPRAVLVVLSLKITHGASPSRRRPLCYGKMRPGGITMAYVVQAEESKDHNAVSKTHEDRKDALVTAVQWGTEGRKVKIIGNGRIYTAVELAVSIIDNE
jgi:hypothetical protein